MITPKKLKRIFAIAISMAVLKENREVINDINLLNGLINIENNITVPILKKRLKWANFLESFLAFNMP